ncbi:HNH endonuclease [Lacisediminihabitans sp. FW035]
MFTEPEQQTIRLAAFRWLDEETGAGRYDFSRRELRDFAYGGERLPLADAQKGIWNPKEFSSTLSIVSMLKSKYSDEADADSELVRYNYRDTHVEGDNTKLRLAMKRRDPLLYFKEVVEGRYVARYPAYVLADDTEAQIFLISFEESFRYFTDPFQLTGDERRYADRISKARLHQPMFRARIMRAYSGTCAICRLKHVELLDAARIISDSDVEGFATVTNGMALCKIHHAAYDRNLLGISPDYKVAIDAKLLDEIDGPMLRYGLQDMNGLSLELPKQKANYPSREALAIRYEQFSL